MKDQALPADAPSQARLREAVSQLELARAKGQVSSPLVGAISGKVFPLRENALGLQSVSFVFREKGCQFTAKDLQGEYPIQCGLGSWERGETALPGTPPRLVSGGAPKPGTKAKVAASGAWKDANTLELLLRYYETPHHDTVTCEFNGGGVQIRFVSSIAQMSTPANDQRPVLQARPSA